MLLLRACERITNALVAAVLAIAAAGVAGCDDTTDCPASVSAAASCTAGGLSCTSGTMQCTCTNSTWVCKMPDMAVPDLSIRDMHPVPEID